MTNFAGLDCPGSYIRWAHRHETGLDRAEMIPGAPQAEPKIAFRMLAGWIPPWPSEKTAS